MARRYGAVSLTIWNDPDFIALTRDAQHAYLMLISWPTLSNCGVVTGLVRQWAARSADGSEDQIRAAMAELEAHRFIISDGDSEEVLVRSFMRNDSMLKTPNTAKSVINAAHHVHSAALKSAIAVEMGRIVPTLSKKAADVLTAGIESLTGSVSSSDQAMSHSLFEPRSTKEPEPEPEPEPVTHMVTAAAATVAAPDHFDQFWDVYPRKHGKQAARKAWAKAAKRQAPEFIIERAAAFAADPNLPEQSLIPHASTWLNGERWDDPPLPGRTVNRMSATEQNLRNAYAAAQAAEAAPRMYAVEA